MSQSAYSWMGSRLHLVLDDDLAAAWNRAEAAFFAAQKNHLAIHGSRWDAANEPLAINWTEEERVAFDQIGRVINLLCEINGGGLHISEEEMTSDYLVKL